jgi:hypothetical protein
MRPLTLACEAKGSLVVYVGTGAPPDDAEWDAYLELVKSVGLRWQSVRIAVFTARDGGAPNALQRKRSAALTRLFRHEVIVISESLVARAAVTALRWLGVEIRAFAPSRQTEAFQQLGTTPEESSWLSEAERRLRSSLRRDGGAK